VFVVVHALILVVVQCSPKCEVTEFVDFVDVQACLIFVNNQRCCLLQGQILDLKQIKDSTFCLCTKFEVHSFIGGISKLKYKSRDLCYASLIRKCLIFERPFQDPTSDINKTKFFRPRTK